MSSSRLHPRRHAEDRFDPALVRLSKFLSLVLRHKPERIGLTLDRNGWASVDQLIVRANAHGVALTPELLKQVVEHNDKQRFAFSPDGRSIRANQGHSLPIDLGLEPIAPPVWLYHGTATRSLASIRRQGLVARGRHDVHLSHDPATAVTVGQRHGQSVVLTVKAGAMHAAGFAFYRSANGVWLTSRVPVEFLVFPK